MIIQHLIVKEFKQIFRNKIFPIVFVILPFGLVNGVPRIATMEIKDLLMTVIDKDHSTTTKQLINKIDASQYINLASLADDYDDGIAAIQSEVSDVIVEFPKDFEKNMIKTGEAEIMLSANATNGTKGAMAQNYITQIITDYFHTAGKGHIIEPRYLYNTSVDYKYYMIPAMMGLFLILIVGFLPAMNIVSEKEKGTIEQINVTPIKNGSSSYQRLFHTSL